MLSPGAVAGTLAAVAHSSVPGKVGSVMHITQPAAWYLAAAAIPVIACYLWHRRVRRVTVASLMFWDEAFGHRASRAAWLRLPQWLSLLLQLVFVALLVTALLDLRPDDSAVAVPRRVLVLDVSASMQAQESGVSRFDQARMEARRLIDRLTAPDQIALLTAGSQPQVVCPFTSDRELLTERLRQTTVLDTPTTVADAVAAARRLVGSPGPGSVIVLSDGGFDELAELQAAADVDLRQVGSDQPNTGVTRFRTRRSPDDPSAVLLSVAVANSGDREVRCRLDLDLDGHPADVLPLTVEAGAVWSATLRILAPGGRVLSARLRPGDAFEVDDVARSVLPRRAPIPVTLATRDGLFLRRVLEAIDDVDLTVTDRIPEDGVTGGVLVIHALPFDTVPPGAVLVIEPLRSTTLWDVDGMLDNPRVDDPDPLPPLLREVTFRDVRSAQAVRMIPRGEFRTLLATQDANPLLVQFARSEGEVLVLAFRARDGDLPLRTSFPVLMANLVSALATPGDAGGVTVATGNRHTAEPDGFSIRSAATAGRFTLRSSAGETLDVPARGETAFGSVDRTGLWRIVPSAADDGGPPQRADTEYVATENVATGRSVPEQPARGDFLIAANLVNPRESNLRVSATAADPSVAERPSIPASPPPVWWIATLAAGVLICADWYLFHRRVIG